MAKYALIKNNIVENIIEWDGVSEFQPPDGYAMIPAEDAVAIGTRAGAPGTIPDISDRQFFQMAAMMSLITQDEALAAVKTGTIPTVLQGIIDSIPDAGARFAATMMLAGATVFQRNHPFTEQVGSAMGWTSQQLDDFFLAASVL
jgi:hypothetical protein